MKIIEIRNLSGDELSARIRALRKEGYMLRVQQECGQLEKPSEIRSVRRQVARAESVFRQRANAGQAWSKNSV